VSHSKRAGLALLALFGWGCSQVSAVNAVQPLPTGATPGVLNVAGVTRKLGYDVMRFRTRLKQTLKPVRMPRQGLLPTKVDLRSQCPNIYDQGSLGSCTAFAMGNGLREFMQRTRNETATQLSPLWLYYEERVHMGPEYVNQDSGANMVDGMWVLENKGVPAETQWPYIIGRFKVKPSDESNAAAAQWKISKSLPLAGFDDVKTALASGKAVAFGFEVYARFMSIGRNGKMPMPGVAERVVGGHAVLAVGYDDAQECLIVRNSWGQRWGDRGYFYMPYAFAKDTEKAMEWFTAE